MIQGRNIAQARTIAASRGAEIRVCSDDSWPIGHEFILQANINPNRINVSVANGIITGYEGWF